MGGKITCGSHKSVLSISQQALSISSNENIRQIYNFEKILGKGSFGLVRVISLKKEPEKKFALKIIEKDKVKEKVYLLEREIMILRSMDHPNIINFYETYQDSKYLYIVMEFCSGGDLMDRILHKTHLEEKDVCEIMEKLFSAINYVHKKKIVHRDLKLENVLFSDKTADSEIKIIDFGLSAIVKAKFHSFFSHETDHQHQDIPNDLNSKVGTPLYVAPEVLKGNYSYECDIWSLGVIMFMLLSGDPPFLATTEEKLFNVIEKGQFNFNSKAWQNVSVKAKDLLTKVLRVSPKKRPNPVVILKHPWFQSFKKENISIHEGPSLKPNEMMMKGSSGIIVDKNILTMLNSKKHLNKFKKEVLKVLINRLTHQDILNLKEAFKAIDTEKTGMITCQELMTVMNQNGFNQSEEEVKKIIKRINGEEDSHNNHPIINYSDFLAATLDIKKYFNEQKLWNIFKYFDVSNNDYITVNDLKEIRKRTGRDEDDNEIMEMIKENDLAKNGKISFEEFCIMLDMDIDKLHENQGDFSRISNEENKDLHGSVVSRK